jgi:molybdopterin-guanine dinucleotide biosynthesis protein A
MLMPTKPSGKPRNEAIAGLILAGGRATRMGGGDKALIALRGASLLRRVVMRLEAQLDDIALSANGDVRRFAQFGLPVLPDPIAGHRGPLAGILAGLIWAHVSQKRWLLSVATDTPFFPDDLVQRLAEASESHMIVCAASGGRRHPVFALWSVRLVPSLKEGLIAGQSRVEDFMTQHRSTLVDWPALPYDPFFNINRPEDVTAAEAMIDEFKL